MTYQLVLSLRENFVIMKCESPNKIFNGAENTLFFQVHRINKSIASLASEHIEQLNLDLSPLQLHVLLTIYNHDGLSQQFLAKTLYRDKSSIQRTVQSFIKKEFIFLEPDPNDGRKKIIKTTVKGDEIGALIRDILIKVEEELKELFQSHPYEKHLESIELIADILTKNT